MLTKRETDILNLIVDDYIRTGSPIGSESIVRNHDLGVSSATVRNEVSALEQGGYLTRPHTSAGSVPLDKGYRIYVETVASPQAGTIPTSVMKKVRQRLMEVERDVEEWTTVAAAVLSGLVENLAIATSPRAQEAKVNRVQIVSLQDLLALVIVVFGQTRVRRQLIRLKTPLATPRLEMTANKVSELIGGLTRQQIEAREMELSPLEEEVVDSTVLMLKEEDSASVNDHYVDGLRLLLAQPEIAGMETMRAVVEAAEDGTLARAILEEAPETGIVRVVIGQENRGDFMWPLSVVIGRYGIPGEAFGTVGAVGPMRMEYSRAIAGVELLGLVMSEMVEGVHGA
jgi:heat-inducible transcriptional repressor